MTMGIHTLDGELDGGPRTGAVLVCSTTGWAFGPVFRSAEDAERFQAWSRPLLPRYGVRDLRVLDDADLRRLHTEWITLPDCQWCGERCIGKPCEEHSAACTPKGELARMPYGVPDHDEPGITRSRVL